MPTGKFIGAVLLALALSPRAVMAQSCGPLSQYLPNTADSALRAVRFNCAPTACASGFVPQGIDDQGNAVGCVAMSTGAVSAVYTGSGTFSGANVFAGSTTFTGAVSGTVFVTTQTAPARSIGVVYQNTSARPIYVAVSAGAVNTAQVQAFTDSSPTPTTQVGQMGIGSGNSPAILYEGTLFFIVLPGNYYEVTGGSLNSWTEWK